MSSLRVSSTFTPLLISPLEQWFKDASDYVRLRQRTLSQELFHFQEKSFILDFVARNGIFHNAAKTCDEPFIKGLIEAGIDINCLDDSYRSILTYIHEPELFLQLWKNNAQYIHPTLSLLTNLS